MPLAGWWERRRDIWRERSRLEELERRNDRRSGEMRAARDATDEFDRLRTTRLEAHAERGEGYYPADLANSFSNAADPARVASLTESSAQFEANLGRGGAWTWRCVWTAASEGATQRLGADLIGEDKAKALYQVAHFRVFNEAVRDRRLVEFANGWPDPFIILQSVPPEIAVYLIGACYGRFAELLDEADTWPDPPGW